MHVSTYLSLSFFVLAHIPPVLVPQPSFSFCCVLLQVAPHSVCLCGTVWQPVCAISQIQQASHEPLFAHQLRIQQLQVKAANAQETPDGSGGIIR